MTLFGGLKNSTPPFSLPGHRHLLTIGTLALLLAACGHSSDGASNADGGSGSAHTSSGGSSTVEIPPRDCDREGAPCSFSDVPLDIIERSLALSDETAQKLIDGMAIAQVAAALSAQADIADVTVDGPVLGFRLVGGRPMIVDVTGSQELLSDANDADTLTAAEVGVGVTDAAMTEKLRSVRTALSSKKVTGDGPQRHALVLSPFRYETHFGTAGEAVAGALNGIRGYSGNVTYLETTNELDPQVTVDVLTQLENYDVIHIDTHGGTLCKESTAPTDEVGETDKKKCADGITDFLVQRFHGSAEDLQSISHPGIVHYRGKVHQSIAVTADFFRSYYPQGIGERLFILGSCNTFRTDMANAIAGDKGIYISWDGFTEKTLVKNTSLALLDSLGLGLTVGEAMARIPAFTPGNPAAADSSLQYTPRGAGGDLRIRDLIAVRDNITGNPLSDSSGIDVMEVPEDGLNDHLNLEFTVDGITPERLASFYVNLVINDAVIGHLNLQESGIPVGDFSYQVSTPVPLPFDVHQGQALHMDFWIPLPDLGEDHFITAPHVNERGTPQVGSEWVLSSQAISSRTDDNTIKTASVVFEIEPSDDPAGSYHYFRVVSGNVRIQRDYEDANGCRFNVDHTIDIPAGATNNYLKFDASTQSLKLDGFGNVASETVQTTGSCGDSASVNVGGVYFIADEAPVSGDDLQGGHNDGAAFPTVIKWTLHKTR